MAVIILKRVRLSYPDLWKPGNPPKDRPNEKGKYGAQLIMVPGSDAAKLALETMMAEARATFGENWQAIMGAMEKSKKFVRKGDENLTREGAKREGYEGMLYAVARNKVQPLIIGPRRVAPPGTNDANHSDGFPILREDGGKPYGGCIVNAKLDVKAMKAKGEIPNQVYASLLTVQFVEDGKAFGAAPGTAEGMDDEDDGSAVGEHSSSGADFDPLA
jgi:hypothetical protein